MSDDPDPLYELYSAVLHLGRALRECGLAPPVAIVLEETDCYTLETRMDSSREDHFERARLIRTQAPRELCGVKIISSRYLERGSR